jgi:hypothetical protein
MVERRRREDRTVYDVDAMKRLEATCVVYHEKKLEQL